MANLNHREIHCSGCAEYFTKEDIPDIRVGIFHVGGVTNQEVTPELLDYLKEECGFKLSLDLQTFIRVRQGDRVVFRDWPKKDKALKHIDIVKFDNIEGEILTGYNDPIAAAKVCVQWGAKEVLVTSMEGIVVCKDGNVYRERFTNRNNQGRTGRGDTAIASYIAKRLTSDIEESLKFSAALTSIKLESVGPFSGNIEDVRARMKKCY